MTDTTEQKALALVNEVRAERRLALYEAPNTRHTSFFKALCRAIEQHEAFRQEVSDAVKAYTGTNNYLGKFNDTLGRFIIAKPDPLVEVFDECFRQEFRAGETWSEAMARKFRAAIEKRGGRIVFDGSGA